MVFKGTHKHTVLITKSGSQCSLTGISCIAISELRETQRKWVPNYNTLTTSILIVKKIIVPVVVKTWNLKECLVLLIFSTLERNDQLWNWVLACLIVAS